MGVDEAGRIASPVPRSIGVIDSACDASCAAVAPAARLVLGFCKDLSCMPLSIEPMTRPISDPTPTTQVPLPEPLIVKSPGLSESSQQAIAKALPKVLLHEHLDGGLRVATLFELLTERGLPSPAPSVAALEQWFADRAHAGSLVEYLQGFALTVSAMASESALERVAFEAAEDAQADGCVLAEFRIAPLLFEEHGLSGDVVVNALLRGLAASSLPSGLIVCAMRNHGEAAVQASADLALRWLGRGVVGFDLAGAEAGWPATRYAQTLQRVQAAGLPLTLHAGEADVGERVLEAVDLGARRIGHGIHVVDLLRRGDSAAIARLLELRVHLEVCPTSNVHTGAVKTLSVHPITTLWRAGISVSFNTDNRLMSCLSASSEALDLTTQCNLAWADLLNMGLAAAKASFLSPETKHLAQQKLLHWALSQNLNLGAHS